MFDYFIPFIGMLLTPIVDFTLYSVSSFLVNPPEFKISRQKRVLQDWHGNIINYVITWYLIYYRFTWGVPHFFDGLLSLLYFFIVDTTFYFLHRGCHVFLYYQIHQKHHLCQPIGSHCARHSHWIDATLENLSFFTPFFICNYNAYCAFICLIINTIWASYIHTYPIRIEKAGFMNSPYLHWIHHQYGSISSCNYSLYFTILDRLFGTLNEKSKEKLQINNIS
jgi:sterol desaturase/sphingolipid hydroxylase (fatty acid hydroxylase superfamily)